MNQAIKQFSFIFTFCLAAELVFTLMGLEHAALSVFFGGTLAALIQYWSVSMARSILLKKSVAIALVIIVFKYAIFGIILGFYSSGFKLEPFGFLIGFLSLIPSLFFLGRVGLQLPPDRVRV